VVHKAFKLATQEKPGACHIELPEDVAKQDTDLEPIPAREHKLRRPAPDHKAIAWAVALIKSAKQPLILAGNGCIRKRACNQLRRFVEQTDLMVAHTFMAKGAIDYRDRHSLFTAGLGSRDHVTAAFEEADLVIAIGYDLIEWPPHRWNPKMDKKIIHIDFEPAETDNYYRCDVEIVSDVAAALWEINERMGDETRFTSTSFALLRDKMLCELGFDEMSLSDGQIVEPEADFVAESDAFPMKPQRILRDLRSVMDDKDILISDVGAHKMWIARHYPVSEPNTCIISNGFCSMGIAVPGAIAAKMVHPERRVVGLCGDGGFLMNVQEIATAVQYEVPCVYLVWEDGGYGLIEWKQENQFGRSSHVRFTNPDLKALADAFRAKGIAVKSAEHFKDAMEEAFAEKHRPSVVVVPVDYSENRLLTKRLGRLLAH
jgi:acetolactate synthase-1/2/3 large subunit